MAKYNNPIVSSPADQNDLPSLDLEPQATSMAAYELEEIQRRAQQQGEGCEDEDGESSERDSLLVKLPYPALAQRKELAHELRTVLSEVGDKHCADMDIASARRAMEQMVLPQSDRPGAFSTFAQSTTHIRNQGRGNNC